MFFLKEIKHFLSKEQCDHIIDAHSYCLKPSTTGINQKFEGQKTGRTSNTATPILILPEIIELQQRVSDLTSLPRENQENPSIIQYPTLGYYNPHYDYFNTSDPDYQRLIVPNGGQRIFTCLLYLNDNFTGGFTHFPKLKQKIIPETGKLVWWNNTDYEGHPYQESLHSGTSVKYGSKWITTVWVRLGNTNAS